MQAGPNDFQSLPVEEQLNKVKQITNLLEQHGLGQIQPKLFEQVVAPLKAPEVMRQAALMIEGNVKQELKSNVEAFKKDLKPILQGINPKTVQLEVDVKLESGGDFIEIQEVVDIKDEEEHSIKHIEGQVLLIDFWATWCPPCQAPMAHNQEMLEHHGARWGDKVRIIGISIDKDVPTVAKHVKAKKWEKVEHFHRAGSTASEDYGVQGVPHVVLVDTHGKIAFVGHPASRNLEQDIETLLKDEKLKGVKGGEDEEGDAAGFKALDLTELDQEVSRFQGAVKELQKNPELKAQVAQLARDFVVLVRETKYDKQNDRFLTKFENINVLVGKQSAIDAVKPIIENFLNEFKGSFTSDWRTQTMQ
eukprot:403361878